MDIAGKARKLERRISRTVDAAVVEFVGRSSDVANRNRAWRARSCRSGDPGHRSWPSGVSVQPRPSPVIATARRQGIARPVCRGHRWSAVAVGSSGRAAQVASGCRDRANRHDRVFVRRRGTRLGRFGFPRRIRPRRDAGRRRLRDRPDRRPASVRLKLTVVKGAAEQRSYAFTTGRIDIGRRSDVVDQRQRLIRTNHVAFSEDGPDENRTVSRRHAHIEFSEQDRCYRLWDDRSAHGTTIIRHGRAIRVPAGCAWDANGNRRRDRARSGANERDVER